MTIGLIEALLAREGIVAFVGAGGKKTTLYALAAEHPGRIGITTTTFTPRFPRRAGVCAIIDDDPDLAPMVADAARAHPRVAFARPSDKPGRVAGIDPGLVGACHAAGGFDATYVKADGARMRAIKAPGPEEPPIPPDATTVVFLVSAAAFGAPLDEHIAHRPERLAAVTGIAPGAPITAAAVGRLLASPAGALQHVPAAARLVAVINAVDDDGRADAARAAARAALDATERIERIVLTSHRRGAPWIEVVERT